jgi:hypothetical protein
MTEASGSCLGASSFLLGFLRDGEVMGLRVPHRWSDEPPQPPRRYAMCRDRLDRVPLKWHYHFAGQYILDGATPSGFMCGA